MKKIFLIAVLFVLTIGIVSPMASQAAVGDNQPNECCKIGSDFSLNINGAKIYFGNKTKCIIGEKSGFCKIDGTPETIQSVYSTPDAGKVYECGTTVTGGTTFTANSIVALEAWGMICLVNTINIVTNWVFYLLMIVVVIMFIIAGVLYLTAGAKPDNAKKAKSMMLYAILGLVVALVAKLIPSVVRLIVGM